MTLIFAGHETTAMALAWMSYLMGQHKDVVQKMRDEIHAAVGDGISVADLPKLPYLEWSKSP